MNKLVKMLDRRIMMRRSLADVFFGLAIIAMNLFLLLVGTSKYISEGYTTTYGITARTFPRAVFIAAIILGALLVMENYKKYIKKDPDEKRIEFHLISLAILADIVFFVFTIIPLGYPIANLIMMIVMYWLSGGKSWVKCIIMSVTFTVCSVLFFYTYLKLSIPMGLLSGIII